MVGEIEVRAVTTPDLTLLSCGDTKSGPVTGGVLRYLSPCDWGMV